MKLTFGKSYLVYFLLSIEYTLCNAIQNNKADQDWVQTSDNIVGQNADDLFGSAIAFNANANIVAIGAGNAGTDQAGTVTMFEFDGSSSWTQIGSPIEGESAGDKAGFAVAISDDGYTVAIGARDNTCCDGPIDEYAGQVRVFQFESGDWVQLGSDLDGYNYYAGLGYTVALSGDGTILAVGAPTNYYATGYAQIYQYDGSSWTQMGQEISGDDRRDHAGSVALSNDGKVVAVGSRNALYYENDATDEDIGYVRVYGFDGSAWVQLGLDIEGSQPLDAFGDFVSLSTDGTVIAIGAEAYDNSTGLVRMYEYDSINDDWNQLGSDILGEAEDDFASTVSLSGDGLRVAIGANGNDGGGYYSGHVRVFDLVSDWVQVGSDVDGPFEQAFSGFALALSKSGERLAIGSVSGTIDTGHVRVFELENVTPSPTATPNAAPTSGATADPTAAPIEPGFFDFVQDILFFL